MVEGVPTELLRIVYEILFSNAPKTPYFTRDFLIAGIADKNLMLRQCLSQCLINDGKWYLVVWELNVQFFLKEYFVILGTV